MMKQRDVDHMDEISNQFSHLKSMIDIQVATQSKAPIFSIVTLGTRELPYFLTVPSYGKLSVITSDESYIEVTDVDFGPPERISLTSISYFADNSYFEKQYWVMEGGAIIVSQPGVGSAIRVNLSIKVEEGEESGKDKITINVTLPVFIDYPYKNSTGGYGKTTIRTNYSDREDSATAYPLLKFMNLDSIKIKTQFPEAWNHTFCDLLNKYYDPVNPAEIDIILEDDYVLIEKLDSDLVFYLEITNVYIYVQIGPGWIIEGIEGQSSG